jgi:hypothetical protein
MLALYREQARSYEELDSLNEIHADPSKTYFYQWVEKSNRVVTGRGTTLGEAELLLLKYFRCAVCAKVAALRP